MLPPAGRGERRSEDDIPCATVPVSRARWPPSAVRSVRRNPNAVREDKNRIESKEGTQTLNPNFDDAGNGKAPARFPGWSLCLVHAGGVFWRKCNYLI